MDDTTEIGQFGDIAGPHGDVDQADVDELHRELFRRIRHWIVVGWIKGQS